MQLKQTKITKEMKAAYLSWFQSVENLFPDSNNIDVRKGDSLLARYDKSKKRLTYLNPAVMEVDD